MVSALAIGHSLCTQRLQLSAHAAKRDARRYNSARERLVSCVSRRHRGKVFASTLCDGLGASSVPRVDIMSHTLCVYTAFAFGICLVFFCTAVCVRRRERRRRPIQGQELCPDLRVAPTRPNETRCFALLIHRFASLWRSLSLSLSRVSIAALFSRCRASTNHGIGPSSWSPSLSPSPHTSPHTLPPSVLRGPLLTRRICFCVAVRGHLVHSIQHLDSRSPKICGNAPLLLLRP
jgi:hypothetical protein